MSFFPLQRNPSSTNWKVIRAFGNVLVCVLLPQYQEYNFPPFYSTGHPSLCLRWQSRAAAMYVDTVFIVCPLIIGE